MPNFYDDCDQHEYDGAKDARQFNPIHDDDDFDNVELTNDDGDIMGDMSEDGDYIDDWDGNGCDYDGDGMYDHS